MEPLIRRGIGYPEHVYPLAAAHKHQAGVSSSVAGFVYSEHCWCAELKLCCWSREQNTWVRPEMRTVVALPYAKSEI